MSSEIEKYLKNVAWRLRNAAFGRDRAVVLAAILSFVPIPPACFLGVLLSVANLFLLKIGRLRQSDSKLIWLSIVVGLLNSIIGAYVLMYLGSDFLIYLSDLYETFVDILNLKSTQRLEVFDA